MNTSAISRWAAIAGLTFGAIAASAQPVTVPPDLTLGQQYRLVFVTSATRNATPTDIAAYDLHVVTAANGVSELVALGIDWQAIGSTAAVDASAHTGTDTGAGAGVPLYRLDGTRLADDGADLWDGTIQAGLRVNESGQLVTAVGVWTGTGSDGVRSATAPLGASDTRFGVEVHTNDQWVDQNQAGSTGPGRIYGISGVLSVAADPNDRDGDGLSNADEFNIHGTDPDDPDTDGDGFDDGLEVGYGTDPLAATENPIESKLVAADAADGDEFAYSVSVSGDTAVVGAHGDDELGFTNSGSAYVFTRSGAVWSQQQKLVAPDAASTDWFGTSVSVSGDTAVVGAYGDDDVGSTNSGSAYVFTRSGGVWSLQQKLVAADAASGDLFGFSVSVSGDTAVVGAYGDDDVDSTNSGSAYAFTRSGGVWSEQAKLVAGDAADSDAFGRSVSVSGDTALVGAYFDDDHGADSGSAYVFTRSGGVWSEQAKLVAGDAETGDEFGISVSLSGDTALMGAHFDGDAGSSSGSAYVFTRSGGMWSEQAKLVAADAETGDEFGISVSLSGDTALMGARFDGDAGTLSGSAYVFTRSGGMWSEQAKLVAADAGLGDWFGNSVSVSGDTTVVGAFAKDSGSGSAYAFDLDADDDGLSNADESAAGTDPLNPDTDGDGLSDGDEVNTYETNPNAADSDADGSTDGEEVTAGTDPLDPGRYPVVLAFVPVGDPGNPEDAATGFGAVAHAYEIGAFEVSVRDYVAFLNAVSDVDDLHALFHDSGDPEYGIARSGSPGSWEYAALPGASEEPVNFVSFYDAMRFVNWLENGQPEGPQDATTTEAGAYTITPGGISANSITREPGAQYVLPSADEWYKAAYYDTTAFYYYAYPAADDAATLCAAPGGSPNTANCDAAVGGPSARGAYPAAPSPNLTFDQGGNVWEWTEEIAGSMRESRGGGFDSPPGELAAAGSGLDQPGDSEYADLGFRVVPEPPFGLGLTACGLALAAVRRWGPRRGRAAG